MGIGNSDLEADLSKYPDLVADALEKWRQKTLQKEYVEALAYLKFKGEDKERTASELRAMVHSDGARYEAVLEEIKAESEYTRIYEKLLAAKKEASLRTAY